MWLAEVQLKGNQRMKSFIEFLIEKMKPTTDATALVDILNADEAVKSTA